MPKEGARVDDLTITQLYEWGIKSATLPRIFPADFDKQGMVRATRVSFEQCGQSLERKREKKDIEDEGIKKSGWYYVWLVC